jgi:hypothetical protein
MLSVTMLSVIMLSVIMLSVIMLSVIMLSVVAPKNDLPGFLIRLKSGPGFNVFGLLMIRTTFLATTFEGSPLAEKFSNLAGAAEVAVAADTAGTTEAVVAAVAAETAGALTTIILGLLLE